MAAGGILYNGQLVRRPGVYSTVDADALAAPSVGATGIVAILGTVEGGIPASAVTHGRDLLRLRRPADVNALLRSGDIKEAAAKAFSPSGQDDIGGAAEVVVAKANPATQSTLTLANAQGNAIVLTSRDYGLFTQQINVEQLAGTNNGRRYIVRFEGETEDLDDVGGTAAATLAYTEPSGAGTSPGWDTMTADVLTGGVRANGTRVEGGLAASVLAANANSAMTVVSSAAGDTTQTVTLYGLVGGVPTRETLALNGTTLVTGATTWDAGSVVAVEMSAAAVGTVTVADVGGPTTIFTLAPAATEAGLVLGSAMFLAGGTVVSATAQGALTLVADGASTAGVTIYGIDTSGQVLAERIALNGLTPVVTTATTWTQVTAIVLGEVAGGVNVTLSGTAARTLNTTQNTLQKAADFFNALQVPNAVTPTAPFGFTWTNVTGQLTLSPAALDVTVSSVNIDNPAVGSLTADLTFVVQAFADRSALLTAAIASGASGGFPSNTAQPLYLAGGVEGTATTSDYTNALLRLEEIRVNTIVDLTGDPAIAALLRGHLRVRAGIGRSEADGTVGIMNGARTAPGTLSDIRSQIQALNTRHLRAAVQSFRDFNTQGELATFQPPFLGAVIAGMQAGSVVGTSLTHKLASVREVDQDNSWSPVRDGDALIGLGAWMLEEVDGLGIRCIRNITTYLQDNNVAYVEASVNEATNFAVFTFRNDLEADIGENSTAANILSRANRSLVALTKGPALTDYQGLSVTKSLDIADVDVEMAPVVPTNFIRAGIHLFNAAQAAA